MDLPLNPQKPHVLRRWPSLKRQSFIQDNSHRMKRHLRPKSKPSHKTISQYDSLFGIGAQFDDVGVPTAIPAIPYVNIPGHPYI